MTGTPEPRELPAAFSTLGYAGLVPFAACVLGVALLDGEPRELALRALIAYGAVILSFLGAVHWGVALLRAGPATTRTLFAGVLPSLAAWVALLLPPRFALTLLVVCFGMFWLYEHRVLGEAVLPPSYLRLRRYLTVAVCSLLALGVLALG